MESVFLLLFSAFSFDFFAHSFWSSVRRANNNGWAIQKRASIFDFSSSMAGHFFLSALTYFFGYGFFFIGVSALFVIVRCIFIGTLSVIFGERVKRWSLCLFCAGSLAIVYFRFRLKKRRVSGVWAYANIFSVIAYFSFDFLPLWRFIVNRIDEIKNISPLLTIAKLKIKF